MPSALKLQSETRVVLNKEQELKHEHLTDKEYLIIEALELQEVLSLQDISRILEQKTVFNVVKDLVEKGFVIVEEEIEERYKPKIQAWVKLSEKASDEKWLQGLFTELERKAPKQLDILLAYFKLKPEQTDVQGIVRADLLKHADSNANTLNALVKKGVFEVFEKQVGRLSSVDEVGPVDIQLSTAQQQALVGITDSFKEKDVTLLHGVTASGKTELYIHLIDETLKQGKQVLYLLPEIALTTQIITRLQKHFGSQVGVYHSKFNDNERVEIWNNVLHTADTGKSRVILGARSALFLPYSNIGLVIVDEEHETSYKQFDPAPRYNARDTAIFLASMHKAKVLLGSATPSLESFYNAVGELKADNSPKQPDNNKYGYVQLTERFGGMQLPEIVVADVRAETKRKLMKSHFTSLLLDHVKLALDQQEQVILFQNRRGFSPMMQCNTCAWVPHCVHCDVSLTYHLKANQLRCHYCGYTQPVITACVACGDTNMQTRGFGTEKIEEELAIFFPDARIARLDYDVTQTKNAYSQIIGDFETRQIDILVGTQMVTKGLDFDNVSTVGILSADNMLNFPDFRAFERSFQLMAQVSGRSGRRAKRGKVIIQAFNPEHPVILQVINNDFTTLYKQELQERRNFHYPPFHRLIELTLKHKDYDLLNAGAGSLATALKEIFGERLLGPETPTIGRIKNYYLKTMLLKIEREASVAKAKVLLQALLLKFRTEGDYKAIQVQVDVDPM
jgi:primosomal protein N' (replication factor Y)